MAVRGRSGWAPSVTLTMGRRSSSLLLLVVAIGAVLVCAADGESGRRGRRLKKRENAILGNQNGERDRESFRNIPAKSPKFPPILCENGRSARQAVRGVNMN